VIPPSVPPGVFRPEVEAALGVSVGRVEGVLGPVDGLAIGSATVELDRAAAEAWPGRSTVPLPDDDLLGARCRVVESVADQPALVLLEPSTEGRLAASLARNGEGPIALYLLVPARTIDRFRVVAPASGVHLSRPAGGPFGRAVLVLDGAPSGPHLIVTEAVGRGTIGP
jgi:hypothetical protein